MSDVKETRTRLASQLIKETRAIEDAGAVDRAQLDEIRLKLQDLASNIWGQSKNQYLNICNI